MKAARRGGWSRIAARYSAVARSSPDSTAVVPGERLTGLAAEAPAAAGPEPEVAGAHAAARAASASRRRRVLIRKACRCMREYAAGRGPSQERRDRPLVMRIIPES